VLQDDSPIAVRALESLHTRWERLVKRVRSWGWPIDHYRVLQRKVAQMKADAQKRHRLEQVAKSGRDDVEQDEYESLLEELHHISEGPEVSLSYTAAFALLTLSLHSLRHWTRRTRRLRSASWSSVMR
jgi:hypothetical protein